MLARSDLSRRLPQTAITAMMAVMLSPLGAANADVQVTKGPTPIPGGAAQKSGDITLRNSKLAIAVAVDTAPPYGVPPGSIVDAAPVVDGDIAGAGDTLTQVDLIPNNWSAWPNTYQKIQVTRDTPDEAAVEVKRDFGDVAMTTTYTLAASSDQVHMVTRMVNNGKESLDLLSGYVLWERSGAFYGIPGLVVPPQSDREQPESGNSDKATASWNALYGENWAFSVHMPGFDRYDYSGRDLYVKHTLEPGDSRTLEGWFQVAPRGDLAAMIGAEAERKGLKTGTVSGKVTTKDGANVENPVVVAYQDGRPYAWTIGNNDGRYEFPLPKGDYQLYGAARAHSPSARQSVSVPADGTSQQDFSGLGKPGRMALTITDAEGNPIDARISVAEGHTPLVEFLGKSTFFTNATAPIGKARFALAPDDYRFDVSAGSGFVSASQTTDTQSVSPGGETSDAVTIELTAHPNQQDWYAADTHHHSLGAEGVTSPKDLFRSQMAEQLDLIFMSDHDTVAYLPKGQHYAEARGVPFIPSIEVSPSWGHFNPMGVGTDGPLPIDSGSATVDEIFRAARASGATVIQSNHPSNAYGYLNNVAKGAVPGGFNPNFDMVGINAGYIEGDWAETVNLWNRRLDGEVNRIYAIGGGSDAHDVHTVRSGTMRLYTHVPGKLTTASYLAAAKAGHGFATGGPLIYPQSAQGQPEPTLFGKSYRIGPDHVDEPGKFRFTVDLVAVDGLDKVTLISEGRPVQTRDLSDRGQRASDVSLTMNTGTDTWCALKVTDKDGDVAYSNAFWLQR